MNIDRRSRLLQIGALLLGTAIAKLVRFVLFQASVFHVHLRDQTSATATATPADPVPGATSVPDRASGPQSTAQEPSTVEYATITRASQP
jgi:hypothetical protein